MGLTTYLHLLIFQAVAVFLGVWVAWDKQNDSVYIYNSYVNVSVYRKAKNRPIQLGCNIEAKPEQMHLLSRSKAVSKQLETGVFAIPNNFLSKLQTLLRLPYMLSTEFSSWIINDIIIIIILINIVSKLYPPPLLDLECEFPCFVIPGYINEWYYYNVLEVYKSTNVSLYQ